MKWISRTPKIKRVEIQYLTPLHPLILPRIPWHEHGFSENFIHIVLQSFKDGVWFSQCLMGRMDRASLVSSTGENCNCGDRHRGKVKHELSITYGLGNPSSEVAAISCSLLFEYVNMYLWWWSLGHEKKQNVDTYGLGNSSMLVFTVSGVLFFRVL